MSYGKRVGRSHLWGLASFVFLFLIVLLTNQSALAARATQISDFSGHEPFHVRRNVSSGPVGLSPSTIKSVYGLQNAGSGSGTIAIIDAYNSPNIAADLNKFSVQYGLPQCNAANPCFEQHPMSSFMYNSSSWELESSLDVEWAHAIAPGAKILLVEARSANGTDLLNAINYARNRPDVVAVSMSWSGNEFSTEASYDNYFTSPYGAVFFASSGDSGTGVAWPAVSPNVIGVGGTTLKVSSTGSLVSETAWSGSGGGVSVYENKPVYQSVYGLSYQKRAVPDVSYDADPNSGVAVYDSYNYYGQRGWYQIGGTSAGAPQWAAIRALGKSVSATKLYGDAKLTNSTAFLRDITSGTNGGCGAICTATTGYDTVTGLGSPVTDNF